MRRVARALCFGAGAFALLAVRASGAPAAPRFPPTLLVDADPRHPVLIGSVPIVTRTRAARAELLFGIPPQPSLERNHDVTRDAASRLAAVFGDAVSAESRDGATSTGVIQIADAIAIGGLVRIALAPPVDDAVVRDAIGRAGRALRDVDAPSFRRPYLLDVALGAASCDAIDARTRSLAEAYARAVASQSGSALGGARLVDRTSHPLAVPLRLLCGDAHARVAAFSSPPEPLTTTITQEREIAYAIPVRLGAPRRGSAVPVVDARVQPESGFFSARVRLPSNVRAFTLYGYADVAVPFDGSLYAAHYRRPNGSLLTDDADELHALRTRLRDLRGVRSVDIGPAGTRAWYARVETSALAPRDDVVRALTDTLMQVSRVGFTRFRRSCAVPPSAVRDAIGDAAARARRLAARLGLTLDTAHPIVADVMTERPVPDCATSATAFPGEPIDRAATPAETFGIAVAVAFPLRAGDVRGASGGSAVLTIDPRNTTDRLAVVPPPFDRDGVSGEATMSRSVAASAIRYDLELSPDNAHGFVPIDARTGPQIVRRLGAIRSTMSWRPSDDRRQPDELLLAAIAPARDARAALAAAQAIAWDRGYGLLSATPESDRCGDASDALALDAIRSAAANARAHLLGRRTLVGIDLTGPFADRGACRIGLHEGIPQWERDPADLDVRLAAYARVTYATR